MLIDSHAHLFDMKKGYQLPSDIYPVVCGYSHGSNKKAVELARRSGYPFALGIAPQTAIKEGIEKLDEWVDFISQSRPNAIGEIGLDYKWAQSMDDVEKEMVVFKRMISLAKEMDLPIVIHSRNNPMDNEVPKNAVDDIIELTEGMRLLMHFYSGNDVQASKIVDRGGYISIIHLHSKERRKVINTTAIDRMVVESDSPYVGRSPETIREAVSYIAEIKGLEVEEVEKVTSDNAMRFFGFRI